MMDWLDILIQWLISLPQWAVSPLVFVGIFASLWLCKRLVYFYLRLVIRKTRFQYDSILLDASSRAASAIVVAISLILTRIFLAKFFSISPELETLIKALVTIILAVAIISFIDRFLRSILFLHQEKSPILRTSGSILRGSLRVIIYALGVLVVLSTMGISITPIVASLGIGSLAVALALQPTLENFFSGIQIIADKPIRVGDYIELESSEQGFVEKIGWRSTWIKMLPNNIIIIPNSVLAKSKVINYYYPEKQLSVPVEVGVHYDSDLEHVERVTLEVAREILKSHKWGIDDYDTFVVFHTFDAYSINFTVMLRAQEYFNRFFIRSAFIKALHQRFKDENIVIPYPINALNYEQEK